MSNTLGFVPGHHDPSCCVITDGNIVAFVEEERMSRKKHAGGEMPLAATEECLNIAGLELEDIDMIGLPRNYDRMKWSIPQIARAGFRSKTSPVERLYDSVIRPLKLGYRSSSQLNESVQQHLANYFNIDISSIPPIRSFNHHLTHAVSAHELSKFDRSLVISMDERGDTFSTTIYECDDTGYNRINQVFG